MSRRLSAHRLSALAVVAVVLLSCIGTILPLGRPAAAQDLTDVLIVAQVAEPKSLDPHKVTSLNDFRILANIYDGLVRFKPGTLEVGPALAKSWTVSEDGLHYTFHLRRGIRFHDGAPFDAEAVKFNFERMLREEHPFHDTGPFPLAFFFEAVEQVTALDTHTVRFDLTRPFAPLLSNLAYPTGFLISPKTVKEHGKEAGRHPAGTGPYRFQAWDSSIRVTLRRNADWWEGTPSLKAVVFRPLIDVNTRVAEFLAGAVDILTEVPADVTPLLRERRGITLKQQTGPHVWYLILNTRHGPFRDVRMRRAVNYAINKDDIVRNVLQDTAGVAAGPVPEAFGWAHADDLSPYPYDLEKAKRLIKEAGYDGQTLILHAAEGGSGMLEPVTMAAAIQGYLSKAGLRVDVRTFEWNAYLKQVNDGLGRDAHMAEMAWMTNDPDTLPYLTLRSGALPEKGGFNSGYYSNPEVDRLIEAARRETDRKARAKLYKKLQRIVHQDAPWLFVANWKQGAAIHNRVEGFRLEPSFLLNLRGVRVRR